VLLLAGRAGHSSHGSTLIEVVMATGLVALFLGSLFTMNSSSMETIKMARQTAAASQVLQQRIEALRIANWHEITDADWLTHNILNTAASGGDSLKNLSETLDIAPYGGLSTSITELLRTGTTVSVTHENDSLLSENALKIVWTVNYVGAPNNRAVSRQTVAILAKGGVAK
jgi:type II secretory pathway pseudopilin PulG